MSVTTPAPPRVLIVGDIAPRLEMDFLAYGIDNTVANNAQDAVARLKGSPFDVCIVPARLADMTGIDFTIGLLRHFEQCFVVFLGTDVDPTEMGNLTRTGRVVQFPAQTDGMQIAEYLQKRSAPPPLASPTPTAAPTPAASRTNTLTGVGMPMPTGRATPRVMSTSLDAAAAPLGVPSSVGTPRAQLAAMVSQAIKVDDVNSARKDAEHRAALQQLQELGKELARANGDNATLRAKLAGIEAVQMDGATHTVDLERKLQQTTGHLTMLEAERAKLREELEEARAHSQENMEVVNLSDDGDSVQEELESTRGQRDQAIAEVAQLAGEGQALRSELMATRTHLDSERQALEADRERLMAELATLGAALGQVEGERDIMRADLAMRTESASSAGASLDAMVSDNAALQTQLAAALANVDAYATEHARLTSELASAQDQLSHAGLMSQSSGAEVDLANAQRDTAEEKLRALQGELEALRNDAARARSEADSAQADLAEATASLEAASAASVASRNEVVRLRSELSAAMEAAEAAASRTDTGGAMVGQLQARLEAAVAERDHARHATANLEIQLRENERGTSPGGDAALAIQSELVVTQEKLRLAEAAAQRAVMSVREQVATRTQKVASLVRALEPFAWGLNRAVSFYGDMKLDGGAEHLRSLQLLVRTLENLSSDVNRVDLLADGIQVDLEA